MKSLKKFTPKDFLGKTREELEQMLVAELQDKSIADLTDMICEARDERIKQHNMQVAKDNEKEVEKQIKLLQKGEYDAVVDYIKSTPKIVSVQLLKESRKLIEHALETGDAECVDYLLKRRVKMYSDSNPHIGQLKSLNHGPFVEELIKLDASQYLDALAKKHIDSAIKGEYGDLVMKKSDAEFFYHTKESYIAMYKDFKASKQYNI